MAHDRHKSHQKGVSRIWQREIKRSREKWDAVPLTNLIWWTNQKLAEAKEQVVEEREEMRRYRIEMREKRIQERVGEVAKWLRAEVSGATPRMWDRFESEQEKIEKIKIERAKAMVERYWG